MGLPAITVLILNWNGKHLLGRCLSSLDRQVFRDFEAIVVDNASTDDSLRGIEAVALPLTVVRNPVNVGFAAACNQAAAGTCSDYILFLNPDTVLQSDSIAAPLFFMEEQQHAGVGICGISLVGEDGKPTSACARFPTRSVLLSEILGLSRLWPNLFPPHFMRPEELPGTMHVDQDWSLLPRANQTVPATTWVRRAVLHVL